MSRRRWLAGWVGLGAAGVLGGLLGAWGRTAQGQGASPAPRATPPGASPTQAVERAGAERVRYPVVKPGAVLSFPRDHGAHPDFRTEWWYATGWLKTARGEELGFQLTFFRSRPPFATTQPGAFVPRQLLLGHAALSESGASRLRHDQRAARAALGLAGAEEGRTHVWIDDWRLALEGDVYQARIAARGFAYTLSMRPAGAPLLQGEGGYSRKGRRPEEASYYYSRPALQVRGQVERGGASQDVSGQAWLDHEWSSTLMAPEAAGWDWIGINLDDGGALMAFRMRGKEGGDYYAGGTWRRADGTVSHFGPQDIGFTPLRRWRSSRSGAEYPVALEVRVGGARWRIEPLFDDQELDSRASTGTIYWEGAVRATRADAAAPAGRGYLELTGYWRPLVL